MRMGLEKVRQGPLQIQINHPRSLIVREELVAAVEEVEIMKVILLILLQN